MKVTAEVAASLRTLQKCHLKSQKKMARIRTKISTAAALATEVAPLLRALQKCHSQMAHIGVKIAKGADAALATLAAEAREDVREGVGPTAPPSRDAPRVVTPPPTAAPPATAPSTAPLAVAPSRKRSIEAPDERRFSGVKWHSPSNLWRATSCGFNLGDHAYKRDAALAVDAFLRVHDPGAPLNLPHLDERYDSTFLVPLDVRLTFDAEGRSVSLDARLTKVRYDPAHANVSRRVWRYRVKLLNAALASDLGLPAKLWDTVGGDSEFAACVIAAPAEQATAPRVPPAPEAAARQEPAARKKLKTVKTEIRQRTPPPDAYDAATDDDEAAALTCVPTPRKSPAKSPSTPSRLTPSRFEALPMFCVDALLTADVPICVAQENRKTGKSRARYALTTSATSCRAFLRLGGKKNDLQNDIVKGHVILDGFDDFSRHPIVASNTSMRKLKGEVSDSE